MSLWFFEELTEPECEPLRPLSILLTPLLISLSILLMSLLTLSVALCRSLLRPLLVMELLSELDGFLLLSQPASVNAVSVKARTIAIIPFFFIRLCLSIRIASSKLKFIP